MLQIHANARTTPAVRAEIARSGEATGVLAKRYGISTETVRKWRKRGPHDCLDRSARPHRLPWKATEEERAVVCALRQTTGFALDDLTFVVAHFLPHLNRDSIWRILRAEGLGRRRPPSSGRPKQGQGTFKDYDLGFVHIDIKHLPNLQTGNGERRKRYLYVAVDRRSRSMHFAVKDDETERSAIAFLREAAAAFPFRLTHVLTDNGSCFTPAFARACAELGAQYRHTRPYSPHTDGVVEGFNGRVVGDVLGITIYSHAQLEHLLRGFSAAYNARRQRVLGGKTPDQVVAESLKARRQLSNAKPLGPAGPAEIAAARRIAEAAKEVSQQDAQLVAGFPASRPGPGSGAWRDKASTTGGDLSRRRLREPVRRTGAHNTPPIPAEAEQPSAEDSASQRSWCPVGADTGVDVRPRLRDKHFRAASEANRRLFEENRNPIYLWATIEAAVRAALKCSRAAPSSEFDPTPVALPPWCLRELAGYARGIGYLREGLDPRSYPSDPDAYEAWSEHRTVSAKAAVKHHLLRVLGFTRRGWNAFDDDARRTLKLCDATVYDIFFVGRQELRPGRALAKLREEKERERLEQNGKGLMPGQRRRRYGEDVEMDERNLGRRIREGRIGSMGRRSEGRVSR